MHWSDKAIRLETSNTFWICTILCGRTMGDCHDLDNHSDGVPFIVLAAEIQICVRASQVGDDVGEGVIGRKHAELEFCCGECWRPPNSKPPKK